jgi:hypothetical protein
MPRVARLFAVLDVNYFEDDRVLEAGDAWQLHFAAILAAKRSTGDGYLTRRQLARAVAGIVADFDAHWDTCIRVGLFTEEADGIRVRSWERWNDTQADIEKKSADASYALHCRWHTGKKGKPNKKCPHCQMNTGRIQSESGRHTAGNTREDVDTDEHVDEKQPPPPDVGMSAESPRALAERIGELSSTVEEARSHLEREGLDERTIAVTLSLLPNLRRAS